MSSDAAQANTPNLARMEEGVALLLEGLGVDPSNPDLEGTAARVARALATDLLDGYATTPGAILSATLPAPSADPVFVYGLSFVSLCPHHLLPWEGLAHLAYAPGAHIVGLSRLAELLRCLSHRLVLQEELGGHLVDALLSDLRATGAGCVLIARHGCLAHRGARQERAKVLTTRWGGVFCERPDWQQLLLRGSDELRGPI